MAPEQLADPTTVDARADLYALGVILFSLLAQQRLHQATPRADLARSTLVGADARPSVRAPQLDIPPELDAICVKATEIDPARRYQTARELHDAVQGVLEGDRDARLRVALSEQHLDAAKRALEAARSDPDGLDEQGRREALRQAGRALALHPTSEQAAEIVASLMLTPPTAVPAEVERETQALSTREFSRATSAGTLAGFGLVALVALVHWVGVRSWSALAVMTVPLLLAYVTNLMTNRLRALLISAALVSSAIAATARIAGPLWLPPLFGVCYAAIVTSIHGLGRWRAFCVGMVFVAVLVPWLLEFTGATAPHYVADGDWLHVRADAVWWHAGRAELALGVACLTLLLLTVTASWHFSAGDMASRRKLQLMAWHLGQLAPLSVSASEPVERACAPLAAALHHRA